MKEMVQEYWLLVVGEFLLLAGVGLAVHYVARWKTRRRYRGRGQRIHVDRVKEAIDG